MKVTALLNVAQTSKIKKTDTTSKVSVFFRIRDKKTDFRIASHLKINPNLWSDKNQGYKDKLTLINEETKREFNKQIADITNVIYQNYNENFTKEDLTNLLARYNQQKRADDPKEENNNSIHYASTIFLGQYKASKLRIKHFNIVFNILDRFEKYIQITKDPKYILTLDNIDEYTLNELWDFMNNEYILKDKYPEIYKDCKSIERVQERSKNTISSKFKFIRTFYNWCINHDLTKNYPFKKFKIEDAVYGTPYFLTIDERNKILQYDFSSRPKLEIQRDIFIFQTLIGCRRGDLYKLTRNSIINGAIEYIPNKTLEGNPNVVRVPLNQIALDILKKYEDYEGPGLFPFITEQKYNYDIKKILKIAGIDRMVTILDPLTRTNIQKPIYEVASSHMARRTFIGNIYKEVADPNLVSSLTGHIEGSQAFVRYRNIDEDIKKQLVKFLE